MEEVNNDINNKAETGGVVHLMFVTLVESRDTLRRSARGNQSNVLERPRCSCGGTREFHRMVYRLCGGDHKMAQDGIPMFPKRGMILREIY